MDCPNLDLVNKETPMDDKNEILDNCVIDHRSINIRNVAVLSSMIPIESIRSICSKCNRVAVEETGGIVYVPMKLLHPDVRRNLKRKMVKEELQIEFVDTCEADTAGTAIDLCTCKSGIEFVYCWKSKKCGVPSQSVTLSDLVLK